MTGKSPAMGSSSSRRRRKMKLKNYRAWKITRELKMLLPSVTVRKKSSSNDSLGNSPSVYRMPSEGGRSEGGAGSAKKKKKKLHLGGGNGNSGLSSVEAATGAPAHTGLQFQDLVGPVNVNPTRQYWLLYPESG
ncbi:hypothetical protein VIGAN_03235700, partial [Vigna angularis var. angularis]